ncbi:plasmid pRiA4b ORF-3 family protein [Rhodococcus sp. ARC_M6]|uniref:plasmid pRiA4b ORF-3 family protein n=1 Tax=Rhodococcus sp. ARC_M6 TaxID=2928852 RepID=UPI001FB43CF4|nr:plasmid pRiA4b ORF-3 family protein [Rhodococcus sp. ARC_M6]MCJ0906514.1 plasmid pRiA4b ORF-3 family protein [Rhodococcus sp. ARC_M6]
MTIRRVRKSSHLQLVPASSEERPAPGGSGSRTVVNYLVTIELDGVTPPIWRRFSVPSNIQLDELHSVVQVLMGWGDQHKHQWVGMKRTSSLGPDRYIMRDVIECDGTGEEDEFGEDEVRLDEVLFEVGDHLRYEYNFEARWSHMLVLGQIVKRGPIAEPCCFGGERACPPEDCEGPMGYRKFLDEQTDSAGFDSEHFVLEEVNTAVDTMMALQKYPPVLDSQFAKILRRISVHSAPRLFSAVSKAELQGIGGMDFDLMRGGALSHLYWLLNHANGDGIGLTASGCFPPEEVASARDELDWGSEWIDTTSGSSAQLSELLEVAKTLKLVRKHRGTLILTRLGKSMIAYRGELWRHIVSVLPLGKGELAQEAGRILLLTLAAGLSEAERSEVMIEGLTALGWRTESGTKLVDDDWTSVVGDTLLYLRMTGAIAENPLDRDVPCDPEWGRGFARMVLSM